MTPEEMEEMDRRGERPMTNPREFGGLVSMMMRRLGMGRS